MKRAARIVALLPLGALTFTTQSPSQPSTTEMLAPRAVRLGWTRSAEAASCPDAAAIEADVVGRLGVNPFAASATDSVEVHVAFEAGVWTATLEDRPSEGIGGSRVVQSEAATCDSLAAATGLTIALLIRERTQPSAAVEPQPATPPPDPVRATEEEADAVADGQTTGKTAGASVFAGTVGAIRLLPQSALGAQLVGRFPLGPDLALEIRATHIPEQHTPTAVGSYGFGLTFGSLGACAAVSLLEDLKAGGCASLAVGSFYVVVFDPTPLDPGAALWSAASLGPHLDYNPVGVLHVLLDVGAFSPLSRRSYRVRRDDLAETIYTDATIGASVMLGLGLQRDL